MSERFDLVIVGAGSGGIVAAEFAARLELRVALVERDRVGGDCLWTGCVPSKALLASAKVAHHMRDAGRFGIEPVQPAIDSAKVFERLRSIQHDLAATDDSPERLRGLGIDVRFGAARLTGPRSVEVGGERLETRFVLLCTGSRPAVPPVKGLEQAGFLTSETLWDSERAPDSLIAIGGGPIACELAQAMARLGVATTLLQRGPRILPRDEPSLTETLAGLLAGEGVAIELDAQAERVTVEDGEKVVHGTQDGEPRSWRAQELLVATGRVPAIDGLTLDEAGVAVGPRGVRVDERMRTSVRSIYAAGDLAGRFRFTHSAGAEAAGAVRNMFFPGSSRPARLVPWCTFTDPELAHAGLTLAQARERHGDRARVLRHELVHSDRARTDGAPDGALVVVTAKDRVVGAQLLAPAAGEAIGELAVAIDQGMKLGDLAGVVHVYPTVALAIQELATEAAYERARRLRFLVRGGRR